MSQVMNDEQRKLAEDNMKLVYHVIARDYPTFKGDEDIVQSGMLGLCRAATKWNESRGAFSTYACVCIRSAICQELRARQPHTQVVSFDTPVSENLTLEDTIAGDDGVDLVDYSFLRELNDDELFVFDLKSKGYEVEDIQRVTGYDSRKVRKILRTIKAKYRNVNNYYGK